MSGVTCTNDLIESDILSVESNKEISLIGTRNSADYHNAIGDVVKKFDLCIRVT